ncbi:hypothetical protein KP509_19G047000 [Ceratopteris richardii]|uniref:Uncharacterized protein n=1 Tax=Ceratopteris richardii TaxID=49495 RepID=A0A8T2SKD5_CERRI|nr:hypothetical protein KP509_19G047000 [Ceratopteris richardii]
MAPSTSCVGVDSLVKPPAPGKASSAKVRKRRSRAKPKPFVKQLLAYNEINFKALVLAHTGVATQHQATFTSPAFSISENSDSLRGICDSSELQHSRDLSSSGYKHPFTTPKCCPESYRAPKTGCIMQQSSYMPQFLHLLKSMCSNLSNSNITYIPSFHSKADYMITSDVSSEVCKTETNLPILNVQSQDIWKRLLHQIMHLGSISSKVSRCLSSDGNTSETDMYTLLAISSLTFLNHIALQTVQNGV